jgi:nitrogen regulatory protein PII
MKMVVAVIRPNKLDEVKKALEEEGIRGITISEVHGHGRQQGHSEIFRGKEYFVDMIPKSRLEVATPDDRVENVITAICKTAQTGEIGDGKIFILPMDNAYRIRTGETGVEAL